MAAAEVSDAVDLTVLREDSRGIPRSLPLLGALVEAEARRYAAASFRPAETDLVRAFRGGANATAAATPAVPIVDFLERIHLFIRLDRRKIRIDGICYVLAGIYLTRFIRSPAGREAGILVEPATAHRLVSVALFLGAKFGGHPPRRWTAVFEVGSNRAIRSSEMADLEERFLRAIDFRLFVNGGEFKWFCRVLQLGHRAPRGSCAGKKRQADAAVGEEDEHRRVRACLPPPALASN